MAGVVHGSTRFTMRLLLRPPDQRDQPPFRDATAEYATFAGDIPAGEYGGGRMTIWDRGTYDTEKWTDREVKVVLHGERVQGRYVLFATGGRERDWMVHRMDPPSRADWEPLPRLIRGPHP